MPRNVPTRPSAQTPVAPSGSSGCVRATVLQPGPLTGESRSTPWVLEQHHIHFGQQLIYGADNLHLELVAQLLGEAVHTGMAADHVRTSCRKSGHHAHTRQLRSARGIVE